MADRPVAREGARARDRAPDRERTREEERGRRREPVRGRAEEPAAEEEPQVPAGGQDDGLPAAQVAEAGLRQIVALTRK
ncbi:MAG TPA: hypothetical protein VMH35_06740 [Streptosporangiaceae bacterium]|nr:hypothetical protein [Streptosporangiaceae bacterium]